MYQFNLKPTQLQRVAGLYRVKLRLVHKTMFGKLYLHKSHSKARCVHRYVQIPQNIRYGPYMVLMSVCKYNSAHSVPVLDEICYIRNYNVDTVHLIVREPHTAVNNNDILAELVDGHVLSDLVKSAEGNNFQFFCH